MEVFAAMFQNVSKVCGPKKPFVSNPKISTMSGGCGVEGP